MEEFSCPFPGNSASPAHKPPRFSSEHESSTGVSYNSSYIRHKAGLQIAVIYFSFLLTAKKAAVNLLGEEKKST